MLETLKTCSTTNRCCRETTVTRASGLRIHPLIHVLAEASWSQAPPSREKLLIQSRLALRSVNNYEGVGRG